MAYNNIDNNKRRSQFIHISSPSYEGNGAVPPLPFLPLPPASEPPPVVVVASSEPIYAATPSQPKPQRSTGYTPGSLPHHLQRALTPTSLASPRSPTHPPTSLEHAHSLGLSLSPPPSPAPFAPDVETLENHSFPPSGQSPSLRYQSSCDTLTTQPRQLLSKPSMTTAHKPSHSVSSEASSWSSALESFRSCADDSDRAMVHSHTVTGYSERSGVASFIGDNRVAPAPPAPREAAAARLEGNARFSEQLQSSRGMSPGHDVHWSEMYMHAPAGEKSGSISSAHSAKGGRGGRRFGCYLGILALLLLVGGIAGALVWYFLIHNKSHDSTSSSSVAEIPTTLTPYPAPNASSSTSTLATNDSVLLTAPTSASPTNATTTANETTTANTTTTSPASPQQNAMSATLAAKPQPNAAEHAAAPKPQHNATAPAPVATYQASQSDGTTVPASTPAKEAKNARRAPDFELALPDELKAAKVVKVFVAHRRVARSGHRIGDELHRPGSWSGTDGKGGEEQKSDSERQGQNEKEEQDDAEQAEMKRS